MLLEILVLGVVNWISTVLIVDSELIRPVRYWVGLRCDIAHARWAVGLQRHDAPLWRKLKYLVGCHLCTGTWVGLLMGVFVHPFGGQWWGMLLSGLAFKGVGHLILELVAIGRAYRDHLV